MRVPYVLLYPLFWCWTSSKRVSSANEKRTWNLLQTTPFTCPLGGVMVVVLPLSLGSPPFPFT